jgi:hypothetical protein
MSRTRQVPMTDDPCARCRALARAGSLRPEMVQRVPAPPFAPLARDGSGKCCRDCGAADALTGLSPSLDFAMARVAVGNDRQEQYRLPGAPIGLVKVGIMAPSAPGDLERHHAWLDRHGWFGLDADAR